jgi:hypothetical protein
LHDRLRAITDWTGRPQHLRKRLLTGDAGREAYRNPQFGIIQSNSATFE